MSENSPPSFSCVHCNKRFGLNKNLLKHCRTAHEGLAQPEHIRSGRKARHLRDGSTSTTTLFKCSLCTKTYTKQSSLQRHRQQQHFLPAIQTHRQRRTEKPSFHEFKDFVEFSDWKNHLEKTTVAKFVKVRMDRRVAGSIYQQFYCHRSGQPRLKHIRLRHVKVQGSCKTGSFCPAAIFASIEESGAVKVRFYGQHVGHQQDLAHILPQKSCSTNVDAETLTLASDENVETARDVQSNKTETILEQFHTSNPLQNLDQLIRDNEKLMGNIRAHMGKNLEIATVVYKELSRISAMISVLDQLAPAPLVGEPANKLTTRPRQIFVTRIKPKKQINEVQISNPNNTEKLFPN